ncbi:carboxymuconolactone decarboxylase family protein [Paenibacillus sp. SI8]|uniref:carboxymuconolactone decarboxylase family protein n=1 Tax=unclassified Paenibacillus TaxID=185978 RepID=UPI0034673A25
MNPYYDPSNLKRIPELMKLAPQAATSFLAFEKDVYEESHAIPPKMKELIAVAVAHVTGCPYCIDVHVKKCKALGGTQKEIFEAVLVAASTRAGAVLSHATHALISFEASGEQPHVAHSASDKPAAEPECFC